MPDDLKERIKRAAEKVRGTKPADVSVNEEKPRMSHEEVMKAFGAAEKKSPNETTTEDSKPPAKPLAKVGENDNVLKQGLSPAQEAQIKARNKIVPDSGKEHNPLITAAKGIKDFAMNTIPKTAAGAAAELISAVPKIAASGQMMAIAPNNEQAQKDLVNYAAKKETDSQKETGNLVKSLSDIHDWKDVGNYLAYNISQAGIQIPLSVATGGLSSAIQESANHYLEGVEEIAKRNKITPEEVIAKKLDKPATAIATGTLSGALDFIGAAGVAKSINYKNVFDTIKAKALSALKSTGTEGATEAMQSVVGQTSKNLQAGDSVIEAASKIDPKEVLEEGVAGAVGAGGLHAISSTVNKLSQLTVKKKSLEKDINNPEVSEEAKAVLQKEKDTTDSEIDNTKKEVHDEHEKVVEGKTLPQTSPTAEEVPERKVAAPAPETVVKPEEQPVEETKNEEKAKKEPIEPITKPVEHYIPLSKGSEKNVEGYRSAMKQLEDLYNEEPDEKGKAALRKKITSKQKEISSNHLWKVTPTEVAEANYSDIGQKPEDILPKGGKEKYASQVESMKGKLPIMENLHEHLESVRSAINEGKYQKAISEGEMTPEDVHTIIEQVGLEAPEDILKLTKNEPTKTILPGETKPEEEQTKEEDKVPEKKERATTQRILKGNYSKAFKDGITEEGIHYIPRTHKLSENEAKALIEDKGEDEAMHDLENRENGMLADNRTMLGNLLMDSFETQADKALKEGNQALSDRLNEKANKAEELLAKHLTESGQAVSAARKVASGNRAVMNTRKEIRKKRKEFIKDKGDDIGKKVKILKEANEEASNEVVKTKRVKEKIDKIRGKQIAEKRPVDIGKEKILKGKQEAKDELNKLFKESASRASSGIDPALAAKIVKAGSKYVYYSIAEGVYDLKQLRTKLVEEFGKDIEPYADDILNSDHQGENLKKLADEFKVYEVKNNTKKAILDNLEEKLEDVVKKHYTEVDKTKKALSEKIVKELGLQEDHAKEISKVVEEEFDRLATEKKRKALNKAFNLNAKGLPIIRKKRQHEQLHEQLIKLSNLGALDEDKAAQLYADKFGLPELSAEQAGKIKELAGRVQKALGKEAKAKAAQDLLNYQAKIGGVSNGEIAMGIWYANVLSGLSTQETNILGNVTQLIGEFAVSSIKNPNLNNIGFEAQHLFKGLSRGLLVAQDVLKTGYQPVKDLKIDANNALENSKWGAVHKYVGRAMVAADAIFYHGNKEMWAAHTALMQNKGDRKKAIESLYRTPERIKEAEETAREEGLTGNAYKRRVAEHIEESRADNITEDANNFASKATFNYEPVGVVGSISDGLNNLANNTIKLFSKNGEEGEVKPLKFVIPFTKVIANVFNEQLNWSPWGIVRAAKGGIGLGAPKTFRQKFTPEERGRVLVKGLLGAAGMTAFFLFSADDEDPLFEITANGTGDRGQNYQLQETGWKPYSIRFRGSKRYWDYRYTPLGLNLALVGFVNDARKYKGEHDTGDKAGIAMMGSVNYIMGSTAVSGMADFFDSFSKDRPDGGADYFEKWEKIAARGAKSFIVPNLVTQGLKSYEEIFDMPIKKSHGLLEEAVKDYPIFNDNLDNLYNVLGEPVTPDQLNKFVPFRAMIKDKGAEHDKIWNMIIDSHAFISLPKKGQKFYDPSTKEERDLTDHEYNEFGRLSGQYIKELLVKDYDLIQSLPKEERREKIEKDTQKGREKAKIDLLK